jgi:exosome complex component MTR3
MISSSTHPYQNPSDHGERALQSPSVKSVRRLPSPFELALANPLDIKTGLTPPASGSAYLELESPHKPTNPLFATPTLKLACTVHGPRPLPRSAAYSPHIALTCHVKYTPFASRQRRGYLRDPGERDIAAQLETALRGVIIGERYPKTGVDVVVTVLEGEEDGWAWGTNDESNVGRGWGALSVLAGCISVASAALVDAGIDVLGVVVGGVAAIVSADGALPKSSDPEGPLKSGGILVLDPNPVEHENLIAACAVGYIASRDEMPLLWLKGAVSREDAERLIDSAVKAAQATRHVVEDVLREATKSKLIAH